METLDLKNMPEVPTGMLDAFGSTVLDEDVKPTMPPEKILQSQIFSEMMSIDRKRAIIAMKAWASFVQLASRTRTAPFETLAEYVPARVIDAGEL